MPVSNKKALVPALSMAELKDKIPGCARVKYKAGAILMKEGSPASSCLYVVKGRVEIQKKARNRKWISLGSVKTGEFVGEMALLSGEKRNATVKALTNVEALEIKSEDFSRLLKNQSPIAFHLALHLSGVVATRASKVLKLLAHQPDIVPLRKSEPADPVDVRQILHQVYSLWAV